MQKSAAHGLHVGLFSGFVELLSLGWSFCVLEEAAMGKALGKTPPGQLQALCADLLSVLDLSLIHAECLSVQVTREIVTSRL